MRALVTGATGFLGQRLVRSLIRPVVLSRNPGRALQTLPSGVQAVRWDPSEGPPPSEAFRDVDVVFHLAGEPIAAGRWNAQRKTRIRESRVQGTRQLVAVLSSLSQKPAVLVSGSAVGVYGDRGDETLDEWAAPGTDFLAEVCRAWEDEAGKARTAGIRVVTPRTGIVLGESGGALARMLTPFRLGAGGRLGSGRQWMPWIHIDDIVGLFLHAAERPEVSGPMNATAPEPVTNREFTRILARVLQRPAIFPAPSAVLRLVFGELADVLLSSQRAVPRVAENTGYPFRYTSLDPALRAILG